MHEQPLQRFSNPCASVRVRLGALSDERRVGDRPRLPAVFSRQGAQLLHFQPRGQKHWLWCAASATSRRHPWWRTGVLAVVWPPPERKCVAVHGWARLIDWKLLDSSTDDDGVRLHWQLQLCDWQVDLHAHLGETLELRLSTEHQDELPCQLSHALHAYWRIGHVDEVALSGLDGAQGYDQLNRQVCQRKVSKGRGRVQPCFSTG